MSTSPERLVCASANPDKVAEIAALLDGVVELIGRPPDLPDVVEDADTLVDNARLKARAVSSATGEAAVADDTGLFVDALDGRPGVRSGRFAGERATYAENRRRLLDELAAAERTGDPRRSATFVTVVVVHWPDGSELVVEGRCPGEIAREERGERGFGYDSVFVPAEGDGRTFAEMTDEDKHALSHRGRAFGALVAALATPPAG